jgi:anti-sigma B factor antagonist
MTQIRTPATVMPPIVLLPSASSDVDKTVVSLCGEHDLTTAHSLSAAIATAAAVDDTDLVLDLSGVQFMDSSTIVALLRGKSLLKTRGRTMTVRNPSRPARYVLGLCDLRYIVEPPPLTLVPAPGRPRTAPEVPPAGRGRRRRSRRP